MRRNWRASAAVGGSPGADDPAPTIAARGHQRSAHATPIRRTWMPSSCSTPPRRGGHRRLVPDRRPGGAPRSSAFPAGTMIAAGGYRVFTETDFNPTPGTNNSFALSSRGEAVYLFSGDASDEPHRLQPRLQLRRGGARRRPLAATSSAPAKSSSRRSSAPRSAPPTPARASARSSSTKSCITPTPAATSSSS